MRNLFEFFVKYYHWLLFILLEVISGVLLFRYNSYQGSVWFTSANAVSGKVYEWSADISSFFTLGKVNRELTQRNFYLERKVNQLSRLYRDATGDTTALERVGLALLEQYQNIPARVVSNSLFRQDNMLTIDKGRADGVKVDMGVVCGTGIVGVVYMVADHYSVVMPVINVRSRVSCTIRNSGYFGYLSWDAVDPTVVYVEDIPRHASLKVGEWVETNGFSAIFPPGVLIGKIASVADSRDGLSYRLKLNLATDFGNLRDVCVVNDSSIVERAMLQSEANEADKSHKVIQ